jgi:hypothetical protein
MEYKRIKAVYGVLIVKLVGEADRVLDSESAMRCHQTKLNSETGIRLNI